MYFTKPFNKNLKSGKGFSEVNGIRFPTEFGDINTYCSQNNLSRINRFKLKFKFALIYALTLLKVKNAILQKDFVILSQIVEQDSNLMHSVMMTSN